MGQIFILEEVETFIGFCETCQKEYEGVCGHFEEAREAAKEQDVVEPSHAF
jgi:hypothetical protein